MVEAAWAGRKQAAKREEKLRSGWVDALPPLPPVMVFRRPGPGMGGRVCRDTIIGCCRLPFDGTPEGDAKTASEDAEREGDAIAEAPPAAEGDATRVGGSEPVLPSADAPRGCICNCCCAGVWGMFTRRPGAPPPPLPPPREEGYTTGKGVGAPDAAAALPAELYLRSSSAPESLMP